MTKFLNNADIKGYIAQTAVTSYLLKADSTGRLVAAIAGTDYQAPTTALLPSGGTAGQILAKIDGTNYNTQWIDNYTPQVKHDVKLGAALSKGTPVYVSSANGTNMIVSAASNASEATSSKTLGLLETGGALNDTVKVITEGLLAGLNTSTATAGDPVWLGPNGTLLFGLANKPSAPVHMVSIGIVTRVQSVNGEIFVKVQNGFELDELHNVALASSANNEGLFYDSATSLWKNKTIAAVLGYTPANGANYLPLSGGTLTGDLTLSGTNPRLYFTDTDNNPDYFISNTDGTFTVYDVTNSVGRFKIYSGGNAELTNSLTVANLYLGSLTNEQIMISGTGSRGIGISTITSGDPYVRLYDNTTIKADIWWGRSGNYMGINSLGAGSLTAINPFGGYVGIGTTSPTERLHVYSSATSGEIRLGGGNGSGNARMYFQAHATNAYIDMYGNNSYLPLQINASPVSFMGGSVGIGTSSPAKTLHVYTSGNEGIYLQGTGGGVWMNIQSAAGNLWSIGAQNDGMGVYNRTSSLYAFFIKDNRQLQLQGYTASSSFSGTAAGYLAFDSSGNVITVAGVAATDNTKLPFNGVSTRFNGDVNTLGLSGTTGVYNLGGTLTNSPSTYGTLLGFWNTDISTQLYLSYNGNAYWRPSASNTFVGAAWRTFLDSSNYNSYSPTLTGGGASGTWGINITGNANNITQYTINQSLGTGNDVTHAILRASSYVVTPLIYSGGGNVVLGNNLQVGSGLSTNSTYDANFFGRFTPDGKYLTRNWQLNDGGYTWSSLNYTQISDSPIGSYTMRGNNNSYTAQRQSGWVAIDRTKTYKVSVWYRTISGSPLVYLSFTQAGWDLSQPDNGGWGQPYFAVVNTSSTTWQEFTMTIGPSGSGAGYTWYSYARYAQLGVLMNYNNSGNAEITGFKMEEVDSTLANNTTVLGDSLYVGTSTSSNIYMTDSDESTRRIHCNSGRIGFLNTSASWGAYCDNSGNWISDNSLRAPIFYDSNNTGYYLDPDSTSYLLYLQMPHRGNGTPNIRVNDGGEENWRAIQIGSVGNYGIGISNSSRSWSGRESMAFHVGADRSFRVHSDGWDSLFEVWGGSGYARLKGSFEVASDIWLGTRGTWLSSWLNQAVLTTSSPTFQEVYANGWFRTTGYQGVYNPTNGAHFYPNDLSYGSWRILGSRNGWTGLHFGGGNGITLMMNEGEFGFHREAVGWVARFTSGTGHFNISGNAASANSATSASYASYLPTSYAGGQQTNPQVYFNYSIGLKVAMTGAWSVWSDTMWINGYSGGDVPWMCALHFLRNSEPRMAISAQTRDSGGYGTYYEILSTYNASYAKNMNQNVRTSDDVSFQFITGARRVMGEYLYSNGWVYSSGGNTGWLQDNQNQGIRAAGYNSYFGTIATYGNNSNGYGGYTIMNNYRVILMQNSSGDFGFYNNDDWKWNLFYNRGNDCWGIGTDNTYSGDGFRCIKYGSAQYGWTTWSDRRAKENISTITGALDKVLNMRGVYFNYIIDEEKTKRVGFIAQELQEILPEAVRYAEEIDEYNVEYGQIVSVLTEAIKEQNVEIQSLKAQLQTLLN